MPAKKPKRTKPYVGIITISDSLKVQSRQKSRQSVGIKRKNGNIDLAYDINYDSETRSVEPEIDVYFANGEHKRVMPTSRPPFAEAFDNINKKEGMVEITDKEHRRLEVI